MAVAALRNVANEKFDELSLEVHVLRDAHAARQRNAHAERAQLLSHAAALERRLDATANELRDAHRAHAVEAVRARVAAEHHEIALIHSGGGGGGGGGAAAANNGAGGRSSASDAVAAAATLGASFVDGHEAACVRRRLAELEAQLHARMTELARQRHAHELLVEEEARTASMNQSLKRANEELGEENSALATQLREVAAHEARAREPHATAGGGCSWGRVFASAAQPFLRERCRRDYHTVATARTTARSLRNCSCTADPRQPRDRPPPDDTGTTP